MRGPGRLAEGIALGAVLALLAVIALLLAHGVQQDTFPASIGEQLIGVCGTIAAAGLAAWGIGRQIRVGQEADERRRLAALYSARISLTGCLSKLAATLTQMQSRLLAEEALPADALEPHVSAILKERHIISDTALHADPKDVRALAMLGNSLQLICAWASDVDKVKERMDVAVMSFALYDMVGIFFDYARSSAIHIDVKSQPFANAFILLDKQPRFRALSEAGLLEFPEGDSAERRYRLWCDTFLDQMPNSPPTERPPS